MRPAAAKTEIERRLAAVVGNEVECPRVKTLGFACAFAPLRLLRSPRQRLDRPLDRRRLRCALDLEREPARLLEVVREDLDELVLRRQCGDPVREPHVKPGPPALRQPAVGDVADHDVLERPLAFFFDQRLRLRADDVAPFQRREAGLRQGVDVQQVRDCTGPEHRSCDGRVLRDALVVRRQSIEARADERLQGLRHRQGLQSFSDRPSRCVEQAGIDQHPHGLLEEKRIASGVSEQRLEGTARHDALLAEQLGEQRLALCVGQGRKLDRGAPVAVGDKRRTCVA